ncbi:hypothetical protein ACN38_g12518, partial [Penicillium nordicum]
CSKQQIANSKQISKGSVCSKQHACMHGSSTSSMVDVVLV